MKIVYTKTNRGFVLGTFTDRYNMPCSIQESSLATEACIWLGIDTSRPTSDEAVTGEYEFWRRELIRKSEDKGFVAEPTIIEAFRAGWENKSRMHLTVNMAKEIRTALDHFIKSGALPHE